MAIVSFNSIDAGLIGNTVSPRRITMVSTDPLSKITSSGYLNGYFNNNDESPFPLHSTDIIDVSYNYSTLNKSSNFTQLRPSTLNGIITLFSVIPGNYIATGFSPVFNDPSTTVFTFTVPGIQIFDSLGLNIVTSTNTVYITTSFTFTGSNTINLNCSAAPGVGTQFSYICTRGPLNVFA